MSNHLNWQRAHSAKLIRSHGLINKIVERKRENHNAVLLNRVVKKQRRGIPHDVVLLRLLAREVTP